MDFKDVVTGRGECREISNPEGTASPVADFARWSKRAGEDGFACDAVDQCEAIGMVLCGANDECLLGRLQLVAYVVDEDLNWEALAGGALAD
jgi:hypothetical protein